MPEIAVTISQVSSALLGLIAALTLFYGSIGIPWGIQTYDGTSAAERRGAIEQSIMKWVGIPAAVLATAIQIALAVL